VSARDAVFERVLAWSLRGIEQGENLAVTAVLKKSRAAFAVAVLCVMCWAGAAQAYPYNLPDPMVQQIGDPVTMFDWSSQNCEDIDIPDTPARAMRTASGQVELFASHMVTRRAVGPTLRGVQHQCPVTMGSVQSGDPSMFADREWLSSPYLMPDQTTAYALVHDEYQGQVHPGECPSGNWFKCWFNSVTLAVSHDGGATFQHGGAPPSNLVASVPYQYQPDAGPSGVMLPSNIFKRADGYYYAMVAAPPYQAQGEGTCVMRTNDLGDPTSWRAWNGTAYATSFINPYQSSADPAQHVCALVAHDEIGQMTSSLTYSTYFNKFVLVGSSAQSFSDSSQKPGFYWSTSSDLIHWTRARPLMLHEVNFSHQCGDEDPVLYPSLLDPNSLSTNFESSGKRADLFFTKANYHYANGTCWMDFDRDLIRIPLEFNKPPDCSHVHASPDVLPSMNRNMFPVTISGATEPDGEPMTVKINSVTQNQPVTGPGDSTAPDAMRISSDPTKLLLRAEFGSGGGRVYRVTVTVTDSKGALCSTMVRVTIPRFAPDSIASYGSFKLR
jgi:hypothetical protein